MGRTMIRYIHTMLQVKLELFRRYNVRRTFIINRNNRRVRTVFNRFVILRHVNIYRYFRVRITSPRTTVPFKTIFVSDLRTFFRNVRTCFVCVPSREVNNENWDQYFINSKNLYLRNRLIRRRIRATQCTRRFSFRMTSYRTTQSHRLIKSTRSHRSLILRPKANRASLVEFRQNIRLSQGFYGNRLGPSKYIYYFWSKQFSKRDRVTNVVVTRVRNGN